ncbi:hypothetical protein ANANG_G00226400 [Anguilla anguilla]|uniref:Chloride channel protein n=1 Tax=Anguilla anguilla TaxID=7936 RepID=A0A9D3M4T8_ANGAN|nr:hypothetical protein ANANG_G00226400 [Anguilla anguilla]
MACCGSCLCCQCCCREGETRTPEELAILGETHDEEDEILPRKDYESLDYDRCINDPYVEVLEGMNNKKAKKYEAVKWMLVFAIGVTIGLVGLFVDFFVRLFTQLKFKVVEKSVTECTEKGCLALSLLELLAFNMTFVFIASVLVLIEPVAGGSGIPEIKSYLNGVKIPGIVRLRTFLCKAVGVLFAVAGGLFVGKEGPMIHSGAIVGAGLPQFQSITFKRISFDFPYFRSDRDKRDFVSAGAAAGVAAAFGLPSGVPSSAWRRAPLSGTRRSHGKCCSAPCQRPSPSTSSALGSTSTSGAPSSCLACSTLESLSVQTGIRTATCGLQWTWPSL